MQTLITCAGKNESFSFAKSIGIGMIEPCVNLSQILLSKKPEKLVFIGTCGLYDTNLELLRVYESQHAFNIELSKLEFGFYSPAVCEVNLSGASAGLAVSGVDKGASGNSSLVSQETFISNASNYICANARSAAKFKALGLDLENMEIFSVLSVAKHFGVEAACFLCASNYCDEKAHETFLANHARAKKNLENFLQEKNYI